MMNKRSPRCSDTEGQNINDTPTLCPIDAALVKAYCPDCSYYGGVNRWRKIPFCRFSGESVAHSSLCEFYTSGGII